MTLTFDDGGLRANLEHAPNVTGVQLQKWMDMVVKHLAKAVQANIAKGGGFIGRRTGTLARSITFAVTISAGQIVGDVWPDLAIAPYGEIQETGGTIVPKHGVALAVPLPAMLTPNGVARGTAAAVKANPQAFGFVGTFIAKGVIFGKIARGAIVPLFALKGSVTLPARRYLAQTLAAELNWIQSALETVTGETVTLITDGRA